MTTDPQIPLCRSKFLRDISTELGRRNPFRYFSVEVDICDDEGQSTERLTVWARTPYDTGATLTLWEDGTVWVSAILWAAQNNDEYRVGFYPACEGFSAERVAESFRDTVSVSTRLCYSESPLPILRQLWKHTGEVQITGTLNRPAKKLQGD